MTDDSTFICIDPIGIPCIVNKSQVPTFETFKFEMGSRIFYINHAIQFNLFPNPDNSLFTIGDGQQRHEVTACNWNDVITHKNVTIKMFLSNVPNSGNQRDIYTDNHGREWYHDPALATLVPQSTPEESGIWFIDPLGRRTRLGHKILSSYESILEYILVSFRGIYPLDREVATEEFEFSDTSGEKPRPMSKNRWKVDGVTELLMTMSNSSSSAWSEMENISYPGRGNLTWNRRKGHTMPQIFPALQALPG